MIRAERLIHLTGMCLFIILLQACFKPSPPNILEATEVLKNFGADSAETWDVVRELLGVTILGVAQDKMCAKVTVIQREITEIRKIIGSEYDRFPGNTKYLVTMQEEGTCYPLDPRELKEIKNIMASNGIKHDFISLLSARQLFGGIFPNEPSAGNRFRLSRDFLLVKDGVKGLLKDKSGKWGAWPLEYRYDRIALSGIENSYDRLAEAVKTAKGGGIDRWTLILLATTHLEENDQGIPVQHRNADHYRFEFVD